MADPRALAAVLLGLVAGCSSGDPEGALARGTAQVGGVRLQVEVAQTPAEREAGLRGRDVPPGTGMAFPYAGGAPVRFTMAGVDRPLVGVFARDGRALAVEQMTPCAGTVEQCPQYGPAGPVDLVVEAAPASLPAVRAGDPVVLTTR